MAITVLGINSSAAAFDILDEFGRVFWKDMPRDVTLEAINKLGPMYRVVESTGLDYGSKLGAACPKRGKHSGYSGTVTWCPCSGWI